MGGGGGVQIGMGGKVAVELRGGGGEVQIGVGGR